MGFPRELAFYFTIKCRGQVCDENVFRVVAMGQVCDEKWRRVGIKAREMGYSIKKINVGVDSVKKECYNSYNHS